MSGGFGGEVLGGGSDGNRGTTRGFCGVEYWR